MACHDNLLAAAYLCTEVGMSMFEDVFAELFFRHASRQGRPRGQLWRRDVSLADRCSRKIRGLLTASVSMKSPRVTALLVILSSVFEGLLSFFAECVTWVATVFDPVALEVRSGSTYSTWDKICVVDRTVPSVELDIQVLEEVRRACDRHAETRCCTNDGRGNVPESTWPWSAASQAF